MREPLEIATASLMQNLVQIRKKSYYSVTKISFSEILEKTFGALGVESPHGGAIWFQTTNMLLGFRNPTKQPTNQPTHSFHGRSTGFLFIAGMMQE